MTVIDSTGLQALQRFADEVHASGRTLILCGAREQPARLMRQAEFEQHVGLENICPHVRAALERARVVYSEYEGRWKSSDGKLPSTTGLLDFGL
jgi:SulP family sulfate permease